MLVCASARLSAQNIAFSQVGARARSSRPDRGGDYADGVRPTGLAVARMLAHITYLSEQGMERSSTARARAARATRRRCWRPTTRSSTTSTTRPRSSSPASTRCTYLYLSRVMDYFEPVRRAPGAAPGRGDPRLAASRSTATGASAPSTRRTSRRELRAARRAERREHEVASPWGHDSFLMDVPEYLDVVREFVR